jgi:hypothetical protein
MHDIQLGLECEHALDAREVQPELDGHLLDAAQARDVVVRVQARPLRRARWLDQAACLIHPQRLRMHLGELRGDRDHEDAAVDRHIDARPARAPGGRCFLGHRLSASKSSWRGLPLIAFAS